MRRRSPSPSRQPCVHQIGRRCFLLRCPESPTKIYAGNVGSHIAQALAPNGQSYSALRIAFAYRDRRVPDCTCNGKDIFGMAAIAIETDLTLRPDDIVATHKDLKVFIGSKRGGRNARDFSPSKTAWDVPRILVGSRRR